MTDPSTGSEHRPSLPAGSTGRSSASSGTGDGGPGTATSAELAQLRAEIAELRAEMARLDADLDESRRLNLRAAELLDIVYESLGRPQGLTQ